MTDLYVRASAEHALAPGPVFSRPVVPAICLRPREAMARTGLTRARLSRELPEIRVGTAVRYHVDDVDAFVAGGRPAVAAREWCRQHVGMGPFASVVYFVQAYSGTDEPGPVKIGISERRKLRHRMATLQTGNHCQLVLVGALTGNEKLEFALHSRFDAHRIRGEWFHPHPDILSFLGAMALGSPAQEAFVR